MIFAAVVHTAQRDALHFFPNVCPTEITKITKINEITRIWRLNNELYEKLPQGNFNMDIRDGFASISGNIMGPTFFI